MRKPQQFLIRSGSVKDQADPYEKIKLYGWPTRVASVSKEEDTTKQDVFLSAENKLITANLCLLQMVI